MSRNSGGATKTKTASTINMTRSVINVDLNKSLSLFFRKMVNLITKEFISTKQQYESELILNLKPLENYVNNNSKLKVGYDQIKINPPG
ncbi:hypothetical protein ASG21_04635 [Chryseobacterium sp. Leaf394]|nr:hypothetical protein ASG21_04635 [Chryseobacterium sp. Leaf394]